jgi:hypothetical protein
MRPGDGGSQDRILKLEKERDVLRAQQERLRSVLADLIEWDRVMGGWDNPAWERARRELAK